MIFIKVIRELPVLLTTNTIAVVLIAISGYSFYIGSYAVSSTMQLLHIISALVFLVLSHTFNPALAFNIAMAIYTPVIVRRMWTKTFWPIRSQFPACEDRRLHGGRTRG